MELGRESQVWLCSRCHQLNQGISRGIRKIPHIIQKKEKLIMAIWVHVYCAIFIVGVAARSKLCCSVKETFLHTLILYYCIEIKLKESLRAAWIEIKEYLSIWMDLQSKNRYSLWRKLLWVQVKVSSNMESVQDPTIVAISCKCSMHIISFRHPEILLKCYISHSPDDKTVSTGVH